MRTLIAILALCGSMLAQIPAGNVCSGHFSGNMQCTTPTGRIYRVVVPANLPDNAPIFVALHQTQAATVYAANAMMSTTGWDSAGTAAGHFIAIFPEATIAANGKKEWCIDFNGCTVDDVAFIRSLVLKYETLFATDLRHVGVAGFSMGADMAYKMARQASDIVTSVAIVEGHQWALPAGMAAPQPTFQDPVNVLVFSGLHDTILPTCGGTASGGETVPSVDEDMVWWAKVASIVPSFAVCPAKALTHGIMVGGSSFVAPITDTATLSVTWTWDGNRWNANTDPTLTLLPPPPPAQNPNAASVTIEFYALPNGGHNWYRTSMTDQTQASWAPDVIQFFPAGTNESGVIERFFKTH